MTAEANLAEVTIQSVNSLRESKLSVQADKDKQFFFEDNHGTLAQPFKFAYLPYTDEEVGVFTQFAVWLAAISHIEALTFTTITCS